VSTTGPAGEVKVTVSVGVAIADRSRTTGDQLLAAADAALYDAKRSGRNRVTMAPMQGEPPPPAQSMDLRVAG
jgi:diguanylate cyclase (GGDEF)-like protein